MTSLHRTTMSRSPLVFAVFAFRVVEPAEADANHVTLGAGVAAMPVFQGSDEYEARLAPLVDVQKGRFFARVGEGIGFNVIETPDFKTGVSVNWMQGYDSSDAPEGIGEVKDALGARVFVSARFRGTVTTLAATQAVTESERGLLVNASLAYPCQATRRLTIIPSLGVTWANEKYMTGYFGVNTSQAAASGFSQYQPSAGLKDISFRINARYGITDKVSLLGSVGVTHLLDTAADSPFVEEPTQPVALIGLTYTF